MGLTTQKNYRLLLYGNTFLIVFIGAVVAGFILFRLLPVDLGDSYGAIMSTTREIRKVLVWRLVALYSIISLFIILGIAVIHLFYSHRIAGPIYRMGKEAARIGQGDLLGTVSFRTKDNLTDMAGLLNVMVSRYRGRVNTVKECLAEIEGLTEIVSGNIRRGENGDDLKQAAATIKANAEKIERCLAEMRT